MSNGEGYVNGEETSSPLLWVVIGVVVIIVFGIFSVWHYFHVQDLLNNGLSADGTVVSIEESRGRRGRRVTRPIINFVTENGHSQQIKLEDTSRFTVGQEVTVYYDADDPASAVVEGSNETGWFSLWVVFCVFGLGMVLFNGFKMLKG